MLESGASIREVCAHADMLLMRRDMFATVQVCEIDLEHRTLRYVNAGHPYPILRRADGRVSVLRSGHRSLLGLKHADGSDDAVASTPFHEGDILVLYTDGLIERRDRTIDESIDELAQLVADQPRSTAGDLVSQLRARLIRPENRADDDVALLVLRRVDDHPTTITGGA
jgi:serine phosphatase RsbU (regulator of sigma subunit)